MPILDDAPKLDEPTRIDLDGIFAPIAAGDGDAPALNVLIGGDWRTVGDEHIEVRSPIDGGVIARAQRAGTSDLEDAIGAAKRARTSVRQLPAAERIAILERAAGILSDNLETVAEAIVVNLGKTRAAGRSETSTTVERLECVREEVRNIFGQYIPGDWMPGTVGKRGVVIREPLGTVAAIGPFNYPLFIPASKIIPALAAGNAVVAKAPSDDPIPLLMFARVLEEAGLPDGALNVMTGPGSELGDVLAAHEDIDMISFTGSSPAGRALARAAGPKPIHLELGGNAAGIVLKDADLAEAVPATVAAAFKNAGQRCSALSRILVVDEVFDDYVERAMGEAEDWTLGDPRADGVDVGPLVGEEAVGSVAALVEDATQRGAKLVAGGGTEGCYHEPTVLVDVPDDAEIVWEETFGPVLTIVRVADTDAALEVANRSRYGLDSAVFTRDLERAWRVASELQVGMVTVNAAPSHGVGHFPFGGRTPDSGVGREGLGYSIDETTAIKSVILPD